MRIHRIHWQTLLWMPLKRLRLMAFWRLMDGWMDWLVGSLEEDIELWIMDVQHGPYWIHKSRLQTKRRGRNDVPFHAFVNYTTSTILVLSSWKIMTWNWHNNKQHDIQYSYIILCSITYYNWSCNTRSTASWYSLGWWMVCSGPHLFVRSSNVVYYRTGNLVWYSMVLDIIGNESISDN